MLLEIVLFLFGQNAIVNNLPTSEFADMLLEMVLLMFGHHVKVK
jgi:hypothetical protein